MLPEDLEDFQVFHKHAQFNRYEVYYKKNALDTGVKYHGDMAAVKDDTQLKDALADIFSHWSNHKGYEDPVKGSNHTN